MKTKKQTQTHKTKQSKTKNKERSSTCCPWYTKCHVRNSKYLMLREQRVETSSSWLAQLVRFESVYTQVSGVCGHFMLCCNSCSERDHQLDVVVYHLPLFSPRPVVRLASVLRREPWLPPRVTGVPWVAGAVEAAGDTQVFSVSVQERKGLQGMGEDPGGGTRRT